jgi:hypothetical protein
VQCARVLAGQVDEQPGRRPRIVRRPGRQLHPADPVVAVHVRSRVTGLAHPDRDRDVRAPGQLEQPGRVGGSLLGRGVAVDGADADQPDVVMGEQEPDGD